MLCLIIHILFFAEISERFNFTKLVCFICIIFWEFRLNNKLFFYFIINNFIFIYLFILNKTPLSYHTEHILHSEVPLHF